MVGMGLSKSLSWKYREVLLWLINHVVIQRINVLCHLLEYEKYLLLQFSYFFVFAMLIFVLGLIKD